ncbi:hypothetical protein GH714_031021 [Hevea brasiliensis]|uniref:F-box associated beta-propeller type 3 domain-containing protein n=1 Tax=Hevea brasiliensis TaxID=3981 RepID=A0A6A6K9N4_HEVBR|nr:hypothetical protein GH714_031021 [Hevea brasiliensis]
MLDFDIAGSCNGWLCLSNSSQNTFHLYNPFTSDFLELPKSTHQNADVCTELGFGFQAETEEYKVLKISHIIGSVGGRRFCGYPQPKAEILAVGSLTWRRLGRISYNLVQSPSQVMVNGRLLWVNWSFIHRLSDNRLISFYLADEKFRMVPNPDSAGFERHGYHRLTLVTTGGCLSVVLNINMGHLRFGACFYDPRQETFKDIKIPGMPNMFEAVAHDGNLNGIDSLLIGM